MTIYRTMQNSGPRRREAETPAPAMPPALEAPQPPFLDSELDPPIGFPSVWPQTSLSRGTRGSSPHVSTPPFPLLSFLPLATPALRQSDNVLCCRNKWAWRHWQFWCCHGKKPRGNKRQSVCPPGPWNMIQRAAHTVTQESTAKHDTAPPLCNWPEPAAKDGTPFAAPWQMEALVTLAELGFKKQEDPGGSLLILGLCSQPENKAQTVVIVLSHIWPRSPRAEKVEDLRGAMLREAPGVPLRRSGPWGLDNWSEPYL